MSNIPPLVFYKDRDNSVLLTLRQDGVEIDYVTVITKVTIKWRTAEVDSITNASLFDISSSGVRLKLGALPLTAPTTLQALVIVHATGWPNGIVWSERVTIQLRTG